jgi:hypothetical protein
MTPIEETGVRELVVNTTERLKRASAGPDDIGSRYARLLELLWKPKPTPAPISPESRVNSDIEVPNAVPSLLPDTSYMHFSPTNDFSWLDLEAVGDYVSGTGVLSLDPFQNPTYFPTAEQDRTQVWQPPVWTSDMSSLLF